MRRLLSALLLLAPSAAAVAQSQVMTIHKTDGTVVEIPVSDVDSVTFTGDEAPELSNSYAVGTQVEAIGSILEEVTDAGYTFRLYKESGITTFRDAEPDVTVFVATGQTNKDLDLATVTAEEATVDFSGQDCDGLTGTLRVAFDKFQHNVTITLDSRNAAGTALRVGYSGAFVRAYSATNSFSVTDASGHASTGAIPNALSVPAATTGASTAFAFGDIEAATAADYLEANSGVWFTVSASKLGGTVDLATETSEYTFRYIDYATATTYDAPVSGTITTAVVTTGNVYLKLHATLDNGTVIEAEYFGPVVNVEKLDDMVPIPQVAQGVTYYDADGGVYSDTKIGYVKKVTRTDGSSGAAYTTLYFLPEGSDDYSDYYVTPQLSFAEQLVNVGKVSLTDLKDGDLFAVKFHTISLTSPDAKYGGYANVPNNGTLQITLDDAGNYEVYLDVTNDYTSPFSASGGDRSRVVIYYKGATTD